VEKVPNMNVKQQLQVYISQRKRQIVQLNELEELAAGSCSYAELAEAISELEQGGALQRVKAHGGNGKTPPLALSYRVNRSKANERHHHRLHAAQLKRSPQIRLDAYFKLPEEVWLADEHYVERVDAYLKRNPLPLEPVPAPERSLELVGDEKWISERGGEALLQRIGLWERMNVISVADPLMLAIHPGRLSPSEQAHMHLIVENKTAFQSLLPVLAQSPFTSLIYGCGKKIIRSIELFPLQLPISGIHRFYYFGDIDYEGIHIWHSLDVKTRHLLQAEVLPALPFYRACLMKPYAYGKTSQRKDDASLSAFLRYFAESDAQRIQTCLEDGGYYPQELLTSSELQQLARAYDAV
jgi:hypothetical protein